MNTNTTALERVVINHTLEIERLKEELIKLTAEKNKVTGYWMEDRETIEKLEKQLLEINDLEKQNLTTKNQQS
jgi:hypothetical protein